LIRLKKVIWGVASFTELETWKQARKIRKIVSVLVKKFPLEEKFRLTDR
jgi:hypothetical protein